MKKNTKKIPMPEALENAFEITSATIKDDFCHYSFDILKGVGVGDTHTVKGKGIIEDDMREAFARFNVHLACIDEVFKHSKIEIDNIDSFHTHELTQLYLVTGFKIKGSLENESVILVGNKYVSSVGGRIELETPKIPLDNLSSYNWYNELKTAVDTAKQEVELYKDGKYTPVVEEEATENVNQLTINSDVNFSDAKV